ncbi:DNA-binding transcriptional LysR family regulator [Streptomyces sp. Amel2xB2]|uniref:LysR family transcriptional regulator n=1 Tax=Streptomyces sp. Amel2xB2 TaxID=1305829 RepID=UPI000DB9A157|nr:LysR family transcriptional regulator [Streptomyces sp. Amel2xB2]RAJ68783.1 DNA-binding transcriptional LysR family regulator [Streptomyces sp. Amel2xB2]
MASAGELPAAATWGRLQTFLTVYETGSARAAAEALHVTPPAVSAAVAALESALGTTLFDKHGRGIVPTDAGETFASYVRKLLGLLAEAAGAVHDADRGRVRVGAVATASEYVLPLLMASFAEEHPQVELSLSVLPRDELFALAADHAVDVVLAGRPPRGSGLVTRARRPNRLILVGRPGMREDPVTATWLLTGRGSGTRDTALSLLTRLQAAPPLLTLGTSGAAVAAARQGLGVTLVHEEAVREQLEAGVLASYAVPGTPLDRPWHLSTTPEPTAAAGLLLRHVCDPDAVGAAAFHTRARSRG